MQRIKKLICPLSEKKHVFFRKISTKSLHKENKVI